MSTILIVEDEIKLATLLQDYLKPAQLETHIIGNGLDVVDWVKENEPSLILLDLMLPGKDGITICQEIRAFSMVPIMMVTAKVDEVDRILGLNIGADDYICKPYSPKEVVARVESTLRRLNSTYAPQQSKQEDTFFSINEEQFKVWIKGQQLDLTAIEFNLINIMAKSPSRIFSRGHLIDHIYTDNRIVSERTIDSHIKKLRKKLNEASPDVEIVQSVYGVGYKLEVE
ncbi:response regulator [Algibacillus agarilyticus]|uniref:response regulator n=1 Tax=Algibacillus agarilyticus TaxID=2234133 RepID=UPI000DCF79F8|nr:response regulator [Algibacillus agarilyticus]